GGGRGGGGGGGGGRAGRRRASGLGRRCSAHAGAPGHVPQHEDRGAAGRRHLGVRGPQLIARVAAGPVADGDGPGVARTVQTPLVLAAASARSAYLVLVRAASAAGQRRSSTILRNSSSTRAKCVSWPPSSGGGTVTSKVSAPAGTTSSPGSSSCHALTVSRSARTTPAASTRGSRKTRRRWSVRALCSRRTSARVPCATLREASAPPGDGARSQRVAALAVTRPIRYTSSALQR